MAKIIKSYIVEDLAQAKGCGRDVRERHEWDDGNVTEITYRCHDKADAKKAMLTRVSILEAQRAAQEAAAVEQAALEAKRLAVIKKLSVEDVADVLMVSVDDASREKQRADVLEVSRG
jgi:hypothetical protein